MIYDNLRDIIKHTHGLGFITAVKIRGEGEDTAVEAIADDKTAVLYGKLSKPITGLGDNTIGLARMGVLQGYLNFPPFKEKNADIKITTTERNDGTVLPSEIKFETPEGHTAHYRFMSGASADDQIKIPKFRGADWDIAHQPTKKNLQDLSYFSNILGSFEPTFSIVVKGGAMYLSIGNNGSDRSLVPFIASGVDVKFNTNWKWSLAQVLSILKLADGAECTMLLSNTSGALKIVVNSGVGEYEYILPSRQT